MIRDFTETELRVIVEALTQLIDNSQEMDEQPASVSTAEKLVERFMPAAYPLSI